jgi:protein-tyrosine phosphatase
MSNIKKTSVLFVCLGNICRSPTGEAVLKKLLEDKKLNHLFHIESAGTADYHVGERPDPRTRQHGEQRGLKFESLAQQFRPEVHFESFDFILCMDENNFHNVQRLDFENKYPHKIHPIMSFAPETGYSKVPDPYYGGPSDFELVIDLVEVACRKFLEQIRPANLKS